MPSLLQKTIDRYPVAVMAISVTIFMGVQAVFSFCGKKTCFAFNNTLYDSWFPYKEQQFIVFASGSQYDSLHITYTMRSQQVEQSVGYGTRPCNPEAVASGTFQGIDTLPATTFFSACRLDESVANPQGSLRVKGLEISWQNIADTGITLSSYSATSASSTFQALLTIGGVAYNNVRVIASNENGKAGSGIANLYIAKEKGVIAFEEYPSGQLWIKQ